MASKMPSVCLKDGLTIFRTSAVPTSACSMMTSMEVLWDPAWCSAIPLPAWLGLDLALAEACRCRDAMSSSLLATSFSSSPRLAALVFSGRRASTCTNATYANCPYNH